LGESGEGSRKGDEGRRMAESEKKEEEEEEEEERPN